MINYYEALSALKSGNAVLIIGAGFSIGAKNLQGTKLLLGKELKEELASQIGFSNEYGLDVVSDQYISSFGETKLIEELKKYYLVSEFDEAYNGLASISKAHIYTTNYDNLVEQIYKNNSKTIKSYDLSTNCKKANKSSFILHINGKIDQEIQNMDNIRLTLGSYNKDFNENSWIKYFADDLTSADAIFIVGQSLLQDLDLRRLVYAYKEKCFIIQHPEITESEKKILLSYGMVCENGVLQFMKDLNKAAIPKTIKEFKNLKLKSFKRCNVVNTLKEPTDQEIFDFIIKGEGTESVYYQNKDKKFLSLINRRQLKECVRCLSEGNNLILHSNLGNGKSVFFNQLLHLLPNKVFLLYQDNFAADYNREIRKLSEIEDQIVIVFDPFNTQYDAIKVLNNFANKNIQFILMARTPLFENMEKRVEEDLYNYNICTINLNKLNLEECEELNLILNEYGLWGKYASESNKRHLEILYNVCKSSLQEIILYLFEKCELKRRFEDLIKENNNKYIKKLLIISFINSVLEFRFKLDDLNLLYADLNIYKNYRDEIFKEFACYNRYGEWEIKSPIIAKAMLNSEVFDKKEIVENLIELTKKLNKIYEGSQKYTSALKQICSCSYLSFIFNYDIDKNYILNYFESVKSISFNSGNYFFWMQYAIACVNTYCYDRAEKYFETAYSYAKKRGKNFSTFQIDNHYARFLLERQISSRNPLNAFSIFVKAHQLLIKSKVDSKSDNRYYQFRVARNYREYYNIFYDGFNLIEREEFIKCCRNISDDLKTYEQSVVKSEGELRNDVLECKNNLNYIFENYKSRNNN